MQAVGPETRINCSIRVQSEWEISNYAMGLRTFWALTLPDLTQLTLTINYVMVHEHPAPAQKIGVSWAVARGKRAAGAKILGFWDP